MKIFILNGSPRPNGNTATMIDAFMKGAKEAGHTVNSFDVARKTIRGCIACEYCHIKGDGKCFQKDDMDQIVPSILTCDMLVIASPIYYFTLSAQMQAVIQRCYCFYTPKDLQKMALILSSDSPDVYDSAVSEYNYLCDYWETEDCGIITAHGEENGSDEKLREVYEFGKSL